MNIYIIVIFAFLFLLILALLFKDRKQASDPLIHQEINNLREQVSKSLSDNSQVLNQQMSLIVGQINTQLQNNIKMLETANKSFSDKLEGTTKVVGDVQNRLTQLAEANKRIYDIGKDISSLQEILRAPKLRGGLGEFLLGDLLSQIMSPEHYELQYTFKDGQRVDAVIKLAHQMVPIDAKFPLENFKKLISAEDDMEKSQVRKAFITDIKKHIDSIASKYILPDEGTFDFAFMYIPAENVYYETIIKDDNLGEEKSICSYALRKKVIPVSPNSFYAYLQAILLGLRGMRIEKSAQTIISNLARLHGDLARFYEEFSKIGTHLVHSKSSYESAERRLEKFTNKLENIASSDKKSITAGKE